MASVVFEFKSDNTFSISLGGLGSTKGKWRVVSSMGTTATIQLTDETRKEPIQIIIRVVNEDRVRYMQKAKEGGQAEIVVLKRI
jgi:hypothetical protein